MKNIIGVEDLLAQMRAMATQSQGIPNIQPDARTEKSTGFSDLLKQSVDKVNETQAQTDKLSRLFQEGDPNIQMSEVMIAMQKSNISFQAMVQVRNKLVQAYQEIMNMPI